MKYSKDVVNRIFDALSKRIPEGKMRPCSLCGTIDWLLGQGYVMISTQDDPTGVALGGSAIPCVAVVCKNCGNTHFINLLQIGLGDLLK
jgi:hypothetical protein